MAWGPEGAFVYLLRAPPDDRAVDEGADRGAEETAPLERLEDGALTLEDRPADDGRAVDEDDRGRDDTELRGALGADRMPGLEPDGLVRGTTTGPGELEPRPVGGRTRVVGAPERVPGFSGLLRTDPRPESPDRPWVGGAAAAELGRDRGTKGLGAAVTRSPGCRVDRPGWEVETCPRELPALRANGESGLVLSTARSPGSRVATRGASLTAAAERRLISRTVVGSTRRRASSPRSPLSRARIGVMSRLALLSKPRNTRSSSSDGRTREGGSVIKGSDTTTPTSSRPRSAASPG